MGGNHKTGFPLELKREVRSDSQMSLPKFILGSIIMFLLIYGWTFMGLLFEEARRAGF